MKINNKYIQGTQILFYEIDMLPDYIKGILNTIQSVENRENLTFDFVYNMTEAFEKIDTSKISKDELKQKFLIQMDILKKEGVNVKHNFIEENIPYSMADYRRNLNYFNACNFDYIIWGETDCYMPKYTFSILDNIKEYSNANNIHRYVVTFAIRKMWDDSWKILEHVDYENLLFYDREDPRCYTEPYSIRYVMSVDEMNKINEKVKDLDIRISNIPRFDGSGLILSSDLIKAGANIPLAAFGIASDDSFMMESCRQIMGKSYIQYIIKNILKVHNREYPNKRHYALNIFGEESTQRKKGDWYKVIRDTNENNLRLFSQQIQNKFLTYKDCLKTLK